MYFSPFKGHVCYTYHIGGVMVRSCGSNQRIRNVYLMLLR